MGVYREYDVESLVTDVCPDPSSFQSLLWHLLTAEKTGESFILSVRLNVQRNEEYEGLIYLSFNVKYMLVDILLSSRVAIFIEVEVIVVIATSPLYTGITIYLPS